jgi:hypothetical protein
MTVSEESIVIGPGGPGLRATFQDVETDALTPTLFREATVTVNVAESHGTAATHIR